MLLSEAEEVFSKRIPRELYPHIREMSEIILVCLKYYNDY